MTVSVYGWHFPAPVVRLDAVAGRVCMVGLGRQGLELIRQLVESERSWRIAAVVDRSVASYARFQAEFHALHSPYFRTVGRALAARDVDAVVVATTAPAHATIAEEVIASGFDRALMVEKPISHSLLAARRLQRAITESNWRGSLGVGFYRRCSEIYGPIYETAVSGQLDQLRRITFRRQGKLSMKGSHYIDLANWLMRSEPVAVSGRLHSADEIDHRGALFFDPPARIQVFYANGAMLDMDTRPVESNLPEGMMLYFDNGEAYIDEPEFEAWIKSPTGRRSYHADDPDWRGRHYAWFENALTALSSGEGVQPCGLDEAVVGLEILVAVHVSSQQGGAKVALPLAPEFVSTPLRIA